MRNYEHYQHKADRFSLCYYSVITAMAGSPLVWTINSVCKLRPDQVERPGTDSDQTKTNIQNNNTMLDGTAAATICKVKQKKWQRRKSLNGNKAQGGR